MERLSPRACRAAFGAAIAAALATAWPASALDTSTTSQGGSCSIDDGYRSVTLRLSSPVPPEGGRYEGKLELGYSMGTSSDQGPWVAINAWHSAGEPVYGATGGTAKTLDSLSLEFAIDGKPAGTVAPTDSILHSLERGDAVPFLTALQGAPQGKVALTWRDAQGKVWLTAAASAASFIGAIQECAARPG